MLVFVEWFGGGGLAVFYVFNGVGIRFDPLFANYVTDVLYSFFASFTFWRFDFEATGSNSLKHFFHIE